MFSALSGRSMRRALVLAAGLGLAAHANASILTFDGTFWFPNVSVPEGYGDRVTSQGLPADPYQYSLDCGPTPNILVDYVEPSGSDIRWKNSGYGNLVNFIYIQHPEGAVQRFLEISLAYSPQLPGPPGFVYLYGFDLAALTNDEISVSSVQVVRTGGPSPNGVIFSQTDVDLFSSNGMPGRVHFAFDPPLQGETLSIRIDLSSLGAKSSLVGIDNIKFGETFIPSSGSAALVAGALGLLANRRRR
jgi:hypothetical protein